jgi:hypothetical protein
MPPSRNTRRAGQETSWMDGLVLRLLSSMQSKSLAIAHLISTMLSIFHERSKKAWVGEYQRK